MSVTLRETTKTSPSEIPNISEQYFGDAKQNGEFRLDEEFLQQYVGKKPNFGFNGLGEFVYYRTYSRIKPDGQKESFVDTARRVVEGCYEIQRRHCKRLHIPWDYNKALRSAHEMFQRIWDFKFLPPGRGLWMMGTPFMWERGSAALNNCFRSDTEIITRDGIKPIGELAGTSQEVLTTGGKWVRAHVRSFGQQEIWKLTLRRSGVEKVIYTTADHRWFARDRRYRYIDAEKVENQLSSQVGAATQVRHRTSKYQEFTTAELRPGVHCLRYVFGQGIKGNVRPSPFGIAHGIAFGDGTTGQDTTSCGTYLYLCGKKNEELLQYFPNCPATPDPSKGREGAIRVADLPRFFRRAPNLRESKSYLYGWLAGYFAADGKINRKGNSPKLSSSKRENLEVVRDVCAILGIGTYTITGGWHKIRRNGKTIRYYGYDLVLMADHLVPEFFLLEEHRDRFINWSGHRDRPVYHWRVQSVEPTGEMAEVFCPQVPDYYAFALADNILTGNCGFVSTDDQIESDPAEPFCFLMDMSMLGVGVGFDTRGAGKIRIRKPASKNLLYTVHDSREGWVDSVRVLIRSYTTKSEFGNIEFNYDEIRPAGSPINGFGGKASGPSILMELHELIRAHFDSKIGQALSSVDITDIMNYIGRCVVAGNVRRTAEIAFGDPNDDEYCKMKNPTANLLPEDLAIWFEVTNRLYAEERYVATMDDFYEDPQSSDGTFSDSGNGKYNYLKKSGQSGALCIPKERLLPAISTWNDLNHHRWASNNSVFAYIGMDYLTISGQIASNGEPGLMWLDNMRDYGRMIDGRQPGIDGRVKGGNPCFAGNMRLFTEQGYINLYDLWLSGGSKEYDGTDNSLDKYGTCKIVNVNGLVIASGVYRTGIKKPIYRVTFDDNSWIDATSNHTMITLVRRASKKKGKTKYDEVRKDLCDLQIGEMIPLNQTVHFGNFHDPAYAELAGWCIGDGSLSPKKDGQIRAECTCYEDDAITVLPKIQGLLHELYATHNRSSNQKPAYAGWIRDQDYFEHHEERVGSNVLGRLLKADGVRSGDKHNVPASIWRGTRETIAAFLRGLASADGFVLINENKRTISVRIKQSNAKFLQDCRLLLNQFGIASSVYKRHDASKQLMNDGKGGKKLYNRRAGYELVISGIKQVTKFLDNIGFIQEFKMSEAKKWLANHPGSNNSQTGQYVKIISIEYRGEEDTYCLTEPDDNRVVIEGYQVGQCLEQSLESYELCNLVESFPANHDDADDYMRTLKFAYLYAKTVTLLPTHNPRTNQVTLRNRRIGLSQSGIVQAFAKFGRRHVLSDFCDAGYNEIRRWDDIYSEWLCVQRSVKVTSVKPSGTVSLVAGATPGIHYPEASTYWRRVRVSKDSVLVKILRDAGFHIEPASSDPDRTVVVKFAISDESVSSVEDISIWEQVQNAADYQKYWADNQVSCTVKFQPNEATEIAKVLECYEDSLKGISFLPYFGHGFDQAPYEPCSPEEVCDYNSKLRDSDYSEYIVEAVGSRYCDNDKCVVAVETTNESSDS